MICIQKKEKRNANVEYIIINAPDKEKLLNWLTKALIQDSKPKNMQNK